LGRVDELNSANSQLTTGLFLKDITRKNYQRTSGRREDVEFVEEIIANIVGDATNSYIHFEVQAAVVTLLYGFIPDTLPYAHYKG